MKKLIVVPFLFLLTIAEAQDDDWEKQFVDSIRSAPRDRYFGLQAGIGSGVLNKGLAFGVGFNYLAKKTEIGFLVVGQGNSKKLTEDGEDYTVKKNLTALSITCNRLFNYHPYEKKWFVIAGIGFGTIDQVWSKENNNTPQFTPGHYVENRSGGYGPLLNLGIGKSLSPGFDLRLEAPTYFPINPAKKMTDWMPNIILSLSYRL